MKIIRHARSAAVFLGLVAVAGGSAIARMPLREQLATVPWTTENLPRLNKLLPDRKSAGKFVTSFFTSATSPRVSPNVGDYGFVSLSGEPMLTFLASIDWSGRAFHTTIMVVRNQNGKLTSQMIHTGNGASADDLMNRVVDLHHDGRSEILVPRLLGEYGGATPVGEVDDVYMWDGTQFVNDDSAFRDYYAKTVLPRLQAALASLMRNSGVTPSSTGGKVPAKYRNEMANRQKQLMKMYKREIAAVKKIISE